MNFNFTLTAAGSVKCRVAAVIRLPVLPHRADSEKLLRTEYLMKILG